MSGWLDHVVHWVDSQGTMSPQQAFLLVFSIILTILILLSYMLSFISTPLAILLFGFGGYYIIGRLLQASGMLSPKPQIGPQAPDTIRFVCISDTHGKHAQLALPPGDVLIHAGDFSRRGTLDEIQSFNEWLGTLPYRCKIVIAGNHELAFDEKEYPNYWKTWHTSFQDPAQAKKLLTNCEYLEHASTEVDGVKIFGSPYTMPIAGRDMAFNVPRGEAAAALWKTVPADTDILVTHGPPLGILDKVMHNGSHVGDEDLLKQILTRIRPKVHIFGHIHEGYGKTVVGTTTFFNAAIMTYLRQPSNTPWVVDLPKKVRK
ncbi:hypothetical protein AC1031_002480 [Aphanomyces cochlioides]|nr:hypothetical protein AC1031_002480 [Aphanomyces cochlioides]